MPQRSGRLANPHTEARTSTIPRAVVVSSPRESQRAAAGTFQVYNCLWSHAGGVPVHIHYVVQPVTKEQMSDFAAHGPSLQVAMFSMGGAPDPADVERISDLARFRFSDGSTFPYSFSVRGDPF